MYNPNTSVATAFAVLTWLTSFALATIYACTDTRGLGIFAVLCMGAGATLTVHQFMVRMADDLVRRERAAFQLGQEAQRMRSVD